VYVPATFALLTHTPYQTVVVTAGSAGDELVARVAGVCTEVGIAAKLTTGTPVLLTALVGPAPKLPSPSTRYPHVLAVSAAGEPAVPPVAGIVLPPDARLFLEVLVVAVRV